MDLRAMLNTEGGAGGNAQRQAAAGAPRPPSRPVQPPPLAPHQTLHGGAPPSAAPATPVQRDAHPHGFRDYSHSAHASPVAHHDYPPQTTPGGSQHYPPHASPTAYQHGHGSFSQRPPVPPLQAPGPHDARSPSVGGPMAAPSPYRHPSSMSQASGSGGAPGYPFPAQSGQQHPPQSPGQQRGQYGSQSNQFQGGGGPYGHGQQQQQPPQSPTVGTPGAGGPGYLQHQRSVSIQSTPTPTSAHNQQPPYGAPPYPQGSPAVNHHPSPHLEHHHLQHQQHQQQQQQQQQQQHHRQTSQPPTPLGPPPRQSPALTHQQPPSPFQQRQPSFPRHDPPHASPQPRPSAAPRMSSNSIGYDAVAESHRRSQSQQSRSERELSMSVSPKTRVSSIPSSAGGRHPSTGNESLAPHHGGAPVPMSNETSFKRETTPAKRKLDDRDMHPEELQNNRRPPPPGQVNGQQQHPISGTKQQQQPHHPSPSQQRPSAPPRASTSPVMSRQKRIRHNSPPVWALDFKGRQLGASRNFYLRKHGNNAGHAAKAVNGDSHHQQHATQSAPIHARHTSRHPSPEATRSTPVKNEEPAPAPEAKETGRMFEGKPFPWEYSIEGTKPIETVAKTVADFIFVQVMNNPNIEEIRSRNIPFEIEAKLGTIIDRQTNYRLELPVQMLAGECVLAEGNRIGFRSSMTDHQHQELNKYLNEQTQASQMHRSPKAGGRLPIDYKHRRERDRFYELPNQMFARLPLCVSGLLNNRGPLKARVTYEQTTGEVLAKIIKARVADLHIYMPHLPLDCRISINLEWEWDGPVEEITQNQIPNKDRLPDRMKDRLSYTHGFYQVDLTQVTQAEPRENSLAVTKPTGKEHELEVELDAKAVLEHCGRAKMGLSHKYPELVDGLLDNIRVLARRCPGDQR